jgi:alpha-tubulin suppressor-like RCC1 family protein
LSTAGSIHCWGSNRSGQLGRELSALDFSASPLKIGSSTTRFTQISAGLNHTCALNALGAAFCWGYNGSGQLGIDSTLRYVAAPSEVVGGKRFSQISSGAYSTCGLSVTGAAFCWGLNSSNQLGAKVGYSSPSPVEVSGGWTFEKVLVGEQNLTCGIETGGRVLCWGEGNSNFGPVDLNLYGENFSGSVLGVGGRHMCLIRASVNLRCYSNYSNELVGVGSNNSEGMGKSRGTLPEPISVIALGASETCGLTSTGVAYCWGSVPQLVDTPKRFLSIDLFGSRKCGVTSQYQLFCWGKDADGKGNSGVETSNPTWVPVRGTR